MSGVERAVLGQGLEVSRVLTGLWQVADQERGGKLLDPGAAARALEPYVMAGFTSFDVADHYGSAELIAGKLAKRRSGVELLTKWVPAPGPASPGGVAAAVRRARERLGTDRIDLFQFHAWNYADPGWLDRLFLLAEHQAAGRIRHLGLTNCDAVHLDMAFRSGVPVVSNQVCYSLLDRRAAGSMTRTCQAHGVKLLAYGTLAGGFLSDRWLGREEPSPDESLTWSQMKYLRFIRQAGGWDRFQGLLRRARRVAQRLGVSTANIACRYVLEQPAVAGVILGARPGEPSHIGDNRELFRFSLDEAARRDLADAVSDLDPIPGDCGDEYRRPPFLTASGDLSHHVTDIPAPYPIRQRGVGQHVSTGTVWEELGGFSRAVRRGNRILVSGTTATHGRRLIGGRDAAAQTHFIIDKLEGALQSLGAGLADVVRTRVYVRPDADWEAVVRAHGSRFADISPANTLIRAELVGTDYRVEIEAEAIAPEPATSETQFR